MLDLETGLKPSRRTTEWYGNRAIIWPGETQLNANRRLACAVRNTMSMNGVHAQLVKKPGKFYLVKLELVAPGKDVVLTVMPKPHRSLGTTVWSIWVDEIYPGPSRRLVLHNELPSVNWGVAFAWMASCLEEAAAGLGKPLHSIAVKEGFDE